MPYGQDTVLGISFQQSGGTASSPNSLTYHPFLSENVGREQTDLVSQNMFGAFNEGDSYLGPAQGSGEVSMEAQPDAIGAYLKAVFGQISSVQSGSFYTHSFLPRTTDWDDIFPNPPVTVFKDMKDGEGANMIYDLCGSLFEITMVNQEFLRTRVEFTGGGEVNSTSITSAGVAIDTSRRWTWDVCSVSVAGSGFIDFKDLTIQFVENLEPAWTLGKAAVRYVERASPRQVTISGTLKYRTQSEWNAFLNETVREMIITCKTTTEVSSGYYQEMRIHIPSYKVTEYKPAAEGPGVIERPFTGKGQYNAGSGTAIEVVLVNNVAGYS